MPPLVSDKAETAAGRNRRAVLCIAALIGGTAACAFAVLAAEPFSPSQSLPVAAPRTEARLLSPTEVIVLAPAELREALPVSGEVQPVHRVTISSQVSGLAESIAFLPGESVAAGDTVLRIAPDDYRLALETEEATLASLMAERQAARAKLDRASRLAGSGSASEASREEAQAAVDILEAGIDAAGTGIRQARLNLDRSLIRAPFAGTLASRTVEPGQMVQAGDTLFSLVDLSVMRLELLVPVDRATALAPGQEAVLQSPYLPGQKIAARVQRIGPEVVSGTRSVPVWLEIDTPEQGLRAGTFLVGEIILRREEGRIALPPVALLSDSNATRVLVIRDGKVVAAPVTRGARWNDGALVEITSGLSMGETVVALPLTGLHPGDTVEIGGN